MSPTDPARVPLDRKVGLLSGHDLWSTQPLAEAGVPAMVLTDGPHGVRRQDPAADQNGIHVTLPSTCFPPAVAVGSSWDPEVAARLGAAVGREARALGVHVVLGPGVNIKRSPLCGRNFEYYSEDPLVSGVLAAAHVRAMQAQGVGASVKHFAVNNQETDRMRVSADVDERPLREIYLPAFERVVTEARPATVMAAYNRVNGVPASQHRRLLTEVLREEWGFEGVVVSDWGAVTDRVAALAAGLDLQMPGSGGVQDQEIAQAVRDGRLDEDTVDTSVRRLAALGAWTAQAAPDTLPVDEHHALARELAADCIVLLKNDTATLPLAPGTRVAVIGEYVTDPRFQGGGSSLINPTRIDTPLDALRAFAPDAAYARGHADDAAPDLGRELRDEAVRIAQDADVAVVFAGVSGETEGFDRTDIALPDAQVALIRAVAAAAPRTVVVLSNGGVVSLEDWHDDVDAIVEGWLLGQAVGGAVADILFGAVNPSGRLAETIPLRLADTPAYLNFPGEAGHVRYGEGVMVGYRHHETVGRAVRYPFGHGLTYTSFETRDLRVERTGDDTATVRVTVANTGDRAGKQVVQVYVATTAGPVRRPARELRAFTKVALRPGESRTVELPLDRRAFAYYDIEDGRWAVAPGDYTVQIGESAAHIVAETTVTLPGDPVVRRLTLDSPLGSLLDHPVAGPKFMALLTAGMNEERRRQAAEHPEMIQHIASMPIRLVLNFPGLTLTVDDLGALLAECG